MESGIQVPMNRPSPAIRPLPWVKVKNVRHSFSTAPQFSHKPLPVGRSSDPDAGDGEDHEAGDPDVACDVVAMSACEDEAAEHRNEECENGADHLGSGGIGVGVVQGHDADGENQQQEGNDGVRDEPGGLAGQVAERFVLRDVYLTRHGALERGYRGLSAAEAGFCLRLSWNVRAG